MSVRYLIPAPVIEWIEQHGLYLEDGASSVDGKDETKADREFGQSITSSQQL